MKHTSPSFSEEQQAAIAADHASVAVVAGAGSGKTLVLLERLQRAILAGGGMDHLLAITFTEKAAAELKARLRPRLSPELLPHLAGSWIGTFHATCARILRAQAPLIGIDPAFRILDENAGRLLLRRVTESAFLELLERGDKSAALVIAELEYRHALALLVELMDFRWHAEKMFVAHTPHDEREQQLIAALHHCFSAAAITHEQECAVRCALDFQGLEFKTLELLTTEPAVREQYRRLFRHILVDEYQDTNEVQAELVNLLHEPGINHLFAVGDPRQSIYRFRGANVACFLQLISDIQKRGGAIHFLNHNFRSRPGIIAAVNTLPPMEHAELLAQARAVDHALKLVAARVNADRPAVTVISSTLPPDTTIDDRRSAEARAIADYVRQLLDAGHATPGDIVFLFQAITVADIYEAALRHANIPVRIVGGRRLLDRPEITDLTAALTYAADPTNDAALIALARSPLIGLSDDDCVLLAGEDGKNFRSGVRGHPQAAPLLTRLEWAGQNCLPSEIIRLVLDETGYELLLAGLDPSGGKRANVERLLDLARGLERRAPLSLATFVSEVRELRSRGARIGESVAGGDALQTVRLMTVHAAKGLEFPIVVLPDLLRQPRLACNAWCFARGKGLGVKWRDLERPFGPLLPTERYQELTALEATEEEAEAARLLYVALTRAREELILPLYQLEKPKGRWHTWLTPLLHLPETKVIDRATAITPPATTDEQRETQPEWPSLFHLPALVSHAPRVFTVSELESFDRCPQEYYLKHVVNVPAEMILPATRSKLPAHVRGSIIHAVLATFDPEHPTLLESLVTAECLAHGIQPEYSLIHELLKPIELFRKSPLCAALTIGERELRFDWQLGAHTITGTFDWLKPHADGCEIIDFKTDRLGDGDLRRHAQMYELQMTAYALAAEAALQKRVVQTTLYFLDGGRAWTVAMNDARRAQGRARLQALIARITERDFTLGIFVPPCVAVDTTCPYHLNGLCWLDRQQRNNA